MKRTLALVVVAALTGALVLSGQTQASGIFPGSITGVGPVAGATCVSLPKQTPCPTVGPAVITALAPVKSMSVSGGTAGPFGVNSYTVSIVSQIGCFSLNEPVLVSALGNSGEAVFRQVNPPVVGGNPLDLSVVPGPEGTATLSLEVWTAKVGPAGLVVKAVWPQEDLEQLQTVVAPAPVPAATGVAAGATPTAVPSTATPAADTTPAPTGTPAPTVTPTPAPLSLATCYSAQTSSIDIRSLPGATCTLSISLNQGLAPGSIYNQGPFIIPSTGVGEVPFTPAPTSTQGTAVTTCTAAGQTLTDKLTFSLPGAAPTATSTPASSVK